MALVVSGRSSITSSGPPSSAQGKSRPPSTGKLKPNRSLAKEYIVIISNLPYHMDAASTARFKDVYWKPLKDLIRKVINKEDDGRDITPQVATPSTVNIEHERAATADTPSKCGYALCSVKQEVLARRALRWLGGNIWYGWPLCVLICCQHKKECHVLDSRWQTMFEQPINLNQFSKISDASLLRTPPQTSIPPSFVGTLQQENHMAMGPPMTYTNPESDNSWTSRSGYQSQSNIIPASVHPPMTLTPNPSPSHSTYINPPEPYASINIMIHIDDLSGRPFGAGISPQGNMLPSSPTNSNSAPSPTPTSSSSRSQLSPTAAPFSAIPSIVPPVTATQFRTSGLPSNPPSSRQIQHTPSQNQHQNQYHFNPSTQIPINTQHGTHPIPPSATVIVRNLHHKTTPTALKAFFSRTETYRCTVTKAEIREAQGGSKKKVVGLVVFATAEEARRASDRYDGEVLEGRRLGVGVCRDVWAECTTGQESEREDKHPSDVDGKKEGTRRSEGPIIANGSEEDEGSE